MRLTHTDACTNNTHTHSHNTLLTHMYAHMHAHTTLAHDTEW